MDAEFFSTRHDHLLVYTKNKSYCQINKVMVNTKDLPQHYDKVDENGRAYYLKPLRAMGGDDARENRPTLFFGMIAPDGTKVFPYRKDGSEGRWRWSVDRTLKDRSLIEWVDGRNGWTPYYRIYGDKGTVRPPETIWSHTEVGSNRNSKAEIKSLFGDVDAFSTPKPEKLIYQIISIATNPGDLVLDSFLGSGTTAAVAHKMGRRWIGVELGDHCDTHCLPRLKKVCDGIDQGGISESVNWKGGGGFKYYYLAPSLLKQDKHGNWIIDERYNADMLAAAMAKHEGFKYSPHEEIYWKQGQSTEQDYIFTTTQFVTVEMLDRIAAEMGESESLLVCCRKFSSKCKSRFENITIKKIPNMLMGRCEFGKDDYSLNIINMPQDPDAPEYVPPGPTPSSVVREKNPAQIDLFDSPESEEEEAE